MIRTRGGNATSDAEFWQVVAAAFVVMALYGVIGLAVGALLRNQIVAVVASLVWILAAERLLIDALPAIGRWTPGGATFGLLQLGPTVTSGTLLAAPIGGLVLVGYTTAAAALALVVAPRRDVL